MPKLSRPIALACALTACSTSDTKCPVRESDKALVDHALNLYGAGKVSAGDLEKSFNIQVVHLSSMTCMEFYLKPGTVGGDQTWCFNKAGKKVLSFQNGQ